MAYGVKICISWPQMNELRIDTQYTGAIFGLFADMITLITLLVTLVH